MFRQSNAGIRQVIADLVAFFGQNSMAKSMKKILTRVVAAVVVLGLAAACLIWLVFYLTSGVVESADRFLTTISQGNLPSAYRQTSLAFQQAQTEASFENVVRDLGLAEYQSASWHSRSVENNLGRLDGTIQLKSGGSTRLSLTLIHEDRTWRIQSMQGPPLGATLESDLATHGSSASTLSPPPDHGASEPDAGNVESQPSWGLVAPLVATHLTGLAQALESSDFTKFHAAVSKKWQSQITPDQFAAAFGALRAMPRDWSPADPAKLILDEPMVVDRNGILVVQGHLPHANRRLVFELKFIRDRTDWGLFGIMVRDLEDPPPVPDQDKLLALVRSSLSDFSQCVEQNDFSVLFENASHFFREQYTPDDLKSAFASFVDKKIDLSGIGSNPITLSKPGAIDGIGTLTVDGDVEIAAGQIAFNLSYLYEDDAWKLMAIGVRVR